MTEGVDYSFDRPDPRGLAAAGKRFAVRYVGTPSSGKSLDPAEAQALRAAGVDLVAVYQTSKGFMASGADGHERAQRAAAHARECGMPAGRPIYFALDTDPAGLTGLERASVERFLAVAAQAIGRDAVGVYGAFSAMEWLVPRWARWGWQTYAWSGGRWSTKAHLTQYRNGVPLAGGLVDLCRSTTTDFGQWGLTQEDDMNETELRDELAHGKSRGLLKDIATGAGVDALRERTAEHPDRGDWRGLVAEIVRAEIAPLARAVARLSPDVDEAELAAALLPGVLGALDVAAIVAAVPKAVRAELAAALAVDPG